MNTKAWNLRLPLDKAIVGANVHCPIEPNPENDAVFKEWECPLLWKWVSSKLKIDNAFQGNPALRFNFARRTPAEVWKTNWTLWYDAALTTREKPPEDISLSATLTFEELTTGYGSDNTSLARPWTGIVARMQDLRRYYYFCLEFPGSVALYRREDNNWTLLGRCDVELYPFTAVTIQLCLNGNYMKAYVDGTFRFAVSDYAFNDGWAGLRATAESFVTDFSIKADPPSLKRHQNKTRKENGDLALARDRTPSAVLDRTLQIPEESTVVNMRMANFSQVGNPQLFYTLEDTQIRDTAVLRTIDGEEIWRYCGELLLRYQTTTPDEKGLSDIIGFSRNSVYLINGRNGSVIAKRAFSDFPTPPAKLGFLPDTQADLSGTGRADEFILTAGANDRRVWALNRELDVLWLFEAGSGMGHDNHICCLDVDGDGREEVFAGGSLIDADGKEIWRQEELLKRLKAPNAGHIDAAQMGFFETESGIPYVHLESSSAGHIVLDARDGAMVAIHQQGHVQGGCAAHFVPDMDGIQVAASCRHGNYGILAIYSGDGRLLSRFQPDYRTDSPNSINWDGSGSELLLLAHDPDKAGLYDWQGRNVVPLRGVLPEAYKATIPNKHRDIIPVVLGQNYCEWLAFRIGNEVRFIRPDETLKPGNYSTARRSKVSLPK